MDRLDKIYEPRRTFADFARKDKSVWLNEFEFARFHLINGHEVLSVLVAEKGTQKIYVYDGEKIPGAAMVLYAPREDISGVTAGQSVEIDGKFYLVEDAQDIQGVFWKIRLTGDVS